MVLGVAMTLAGYEKLIPAGGLHRSHPLAGFDAYSHMIVTLGLPYWVGYVSLLTEFAGGLLLVLGLLTRCAAILVALNLLLLLIRVDLAQGYAASEHNIALFAMALLLFTTGSGALALDRRLGL
jgi:putative oxidoreductase